MAGLRSMYGYEKNRNEHLDEMLQTGQVPMDVNAMPGLVTDKSGDESQETEGSVNALQKGDTCFFLQETRTYEERLP